jgi:mannan endo-1,4-beta-mannosidase
MQMRLLRLLLTNGLARAAGALTLAVAPVFQGCQRADYPRTQSYPEARPAAEANEADRSGREDPLAGPTKAFGIYQWNKDYTYQGGLEEEISSLGTSPTYAMYFVDMDMAFPADIIRFNATRNIKTILSQELRRYSNREDVHALDSILAGKWDGHFRRLAKGAKASREVIYYRFGFEMNGDWFPWGEQPEKFVKAWKRAWKIFREEKADNVRWVFSANVIWEDRTVKKDILPYYPGDRYVDIVGLDGYNFGDNHSRHHKWKSFSEVFKVSMDGLKRHFPRKPVWITEIGCAGGPGKAEWIQDFLARFTADPAVRVFIWFNEDKQYAGEPNWRFDSDGDSLKKFRSWAIYNNSITYFSLPERPFGGAATQ